MGRSGFIVVAFAALAFTLGCKSSTSDGGRGGSGGGTGGTGQSSGGGGGAASGSGGGGGGIAGAGGGGMSFDAGSAPDRNNVTAGKVCARIAAISCAGEVACCTSPKETPEACVAASMKDCAQLDMVSKSPKVGFDTTLASTAFTEYERRASSCEPSITAWAYSTDGFESSFTGTLGEGADCTAPGGFAGATALDLQVALTSCRLADKVACMPAPDPMKWTCTKRAASSGKCYTDFNCQDGLYCDNPMFDPTNGKCAARKAAGSKCTLATECGSFVCKGGMCAAADDVQAAYCVK